MKRPRKDGLCVRCNKRPALFKRLGKVKRDKDHNLCLQCFRSVDESNRAKRLDWGLTEKTDGFRHRPVG